MQKRRRMQLIGCNILGENTLQKTKIKIIKFSNILKTIYKLNNTNQKTKLENNLSLILDNHTKILKNNLKNKFIYNSKYKNTTQG